MPPNFCSTSKPLLVSMGSLQVLYGKERVGGGGHMSLEVIAVLRAWQEEVLQQRLLTPTP